MLNDFIGDSTLTILKTQSVLDTRPYSDLTRWEKIRTYLFIALVKSVANFLFYILPAMLLVSIIRTFTFYIHNIKPLGELFLDLGWGEVTWWKFMLADMCMTYAAILVFIIPFKLGRTIYSFYKHRKNKI